MVSRVSAGILHAAGLPELIVETLQDYEAMALRLAREPDTLRAFRDQLAQRHATAALFNADRFRRHVEAAFVAMDERRRRGEAPVSFDVPHLD